VVKEKKIFLIAGPIAMRFVFNTTAFNNCQNIIFVETPRRKKK